jgi:hypothetical protein
LALGVAAQAKTSKPSTPRKAARSAAVAATPPAKIAVGKAMLWTEFVDNDSLRVQGLSNRPKLEWNSGMLFVFPDARSRTFWMIDCSFDLDIAYLDPHGVVRDIQTMVIEPGVSPEMLSRYPSRTDDIMYALEVNRGWMTSSGLKVGDTIPAVTLYTTRR